MAKALQHPGPNATSAQLAQWLGAHATAEGLPAELPVMAGLVESGLKNLPGGDRDSVGLFQMRRGIWDQGAYRGYATNPDLQVRWFLDQAKNVKRQWDAHGRALTPETYGEFIADIERPAAQYRGRYQTRLPEAQQLLAAMSDTAPAPSSPTGIAPPSSAGGVSAPSFDRKAFLQSTLDRYGDITGLPSLQIPDSLDLEIEVDDQPELHPETGAPTGRKVPGAPPRPDQVGQAIVKGAEQFLGVKYVWGGESLEEGGFDCSGLVYHVLGKLGIQVPRVSQAQFQSGQVVDPAQAQAGDLVFFRSSGSASAPGHVGIALGDGRFIKAPHTGDVVKISSLADRDDLVGVRRYRAAA